MKILKLNDDDLKLLRLLASGPKNFDALVTSHAPNGWKDAAAFTLQLQRLRDAGAMETFQNPNSAVVLYRITDAGVAEIEKGNE